MENQKPIGVILCGGESSRMGVDKSLINYHGVSQREYMNMLMHPFCSPVLYSVGSRIELEENSFSDLEEYAGHGPISGLLSIHHYFPNRDLLLVGCDYPLIMQEDMTQLIENYKEDLDAVCYVSGATKRAEPLITLYSAAFCRTILQRFQAGEYSLKRLLDEGETKELEIDNPLRLTSADRPEDVNRVRQIIQTGYTTFES